MYLMDIWYSFPVLVYCTNKNLATLPSSCQLPVAMLLCNLLAFDMMIKIFERKTPPSIRIHYECYINWLPSKGKNDLTYNGGH
jgi:hypothetical protein